MSRRNIQTGKIGYVTDGDEIPRNAIMLSSEQVLNLQRKVVDDWKPSREM